MRKNIGNLDRIVRIILSVVFAALYFMEVITGTIGLVLLIAGGVLLATALIDFCPIYKIFGINTIPPDEMD
ncbi:MAG: DUF2892 domain-containing protein [Bacteroidota bacterium]|jgi:hypothetical protein